MASRETHYQPYSVYLASQKHISTLRDMATEQKFDVECKIASFKVIFGSKMGTAQVQTFELKLLGCNVPG